MLVSIAGGFEQAHLEAPQAASSPFRLLLHPFHPATPCFVVIVSVHYFESQRAGIAAALFFPYYIFLFGIDVGVEVEDDRSNSVLHQAFDDRSEERRVGK